MNAPTHIGRRYRVPTITPELDPVSLEDFDIDRVREFVRRHDTNQLDAPASISDCGDDEPLVIDADALSRIETLALCGQIEHARREALEIISEKIGRAL